MSTPANRLAVVELRHLKKSTPESKKLRREANYVSSTPRCGNCINFQYALKTARGVSTGYLCRLLVSRVEAVGLCDHWTGEDGSTLE